MILAYEEATGKPLRWSSSGVDMEGEGIWLMMVDDDLDYANCLVVDGVLVPCPDPTENENLVAWRKVAVIGVHMFGALAIEQGILTEAEVMGWLTRTNLPPDIEAALSIIPDPVMRMRGKLLVMTVSEIRRLDPFFLLLAAYRGLTDAQCDQLFGGMPA